MHVLRTKKKKKKNRIGTNVKLSLNRYFYKKSRVNIYSNEDKKFVFIWLIKVFIKEQNRIYQIFSKEEWKKNVRLLKKLVNENLWFLKQCIQQLDIKK